MKHVWMLVLISSMAACSSPPKPPTYYGAPRVPINTSIVVPAIKMVDSAMIPN